MLNTRFISKFHIKNMLKRQDSNNLKPDGNSVSSHRLMLFDLSINGHHPGYIRHLIKYWHQEKLVCKIIVVVSPRFLVEHSDVVELGCELGSETIEFLAISQDEEDNLRSRRGSFSRNFRNFQEWFIFCRYAKQLKIDHALLMYYDTYQYPLALRLNPPCLVSGIYFRPTFHYKYLSQQQKRSVNLKTNWEKRILKMVLRNPKLHALLTIDPLLIQYLEQNPIYSKVMHAPDPVEICEYSQNQLNHIKSSLKVDKSRKSFLLFGALTERKGIYQVLDAIQLLPVETCRKIALILVGEAAKEQQIQIESRILKLLKSRPVQIYRKYQFLPEVEVQAYFEISDYVLALYQCHVGMSGILNLAAAKNKPVLSSDFGLMGALVQQYELGNVIDSSNPAMIAESIKDLVEDGAKDITINGIRRFAEQNSWTQFSKRIFQELMFMPS